MYGMLAYRLLELVKGPQTIVFAIVAAIDGELVSKMVKTEDQQIFECI